MSTFQYINGNKLKTEALYGLHSMDARNIKNKFKIIKEPQKIMCTITSPPYHDLLQYGETENQIGYGQDFFTYLTDIISLFQDLYDLSSNKGSLWIIIDSYSKSKELIPLPFILIDKTKKKRNEKDGHGWILKNIFIWKKDKTRPWIRKGQLRKIFEYILFFVKSEDFKFNQDRIRIFDTSQFKEWWVKYPERYNPKGMLPTNVWNFPIPVQGSWGHNSLKHSNPLPIGLIQRILNLCTDEKDLVCDPFSGSGTVLAVANNMNRKFIGCELNEQYVNNFEYNKNYIEKLMIYDNDLKKEENELQKSLAELIINLRFMKYPKILLKKLKEIYKDEKCFDDINSIFMFKNNININGMIDKNDKRYTYYGEGFIQFILNNKSYYDYEKIKNVIKMRSFKKYQLLFDVKFITINDIKNYIGKDTELWLYKSSKFYKYEKKININQFIYDVSRPEWNNFFYKNEPPIISNIELNMNIRKSYMSKEEKNWLRKKRIRDITKDDYLFDCNSF